MRALAVPLALLLALAPSGARAAFVRAQGAAFTLDGAPLELKGEDASGAEDALQRLAGARQRGVNLLHLRLDALPASGTPGVPSEEGWRALDRVLAVAARQGVRVLPSLASFRAGGGAQRMALGLGGRSESLYLADGRAREWYLYLLQAALRRRSSADGLAYAEHPALLGWSLAADLGDPEDPAGARAVNWALRASALARSLDRAHLVGLHFAQAVPAGLAAVQDLDFVALPESASGTARAELARPLLFAGPQGWRSAPAGAGPRLGALDLRLRDAHSAVLTARTSSRATLRVDYGSDGLLDRSLTAPPAQAFTVALAGLRPGARYAVRVSAAGPAGEVAAAPLQFLEAPGEAPLPPAPMPPFSGRIIKARDGRFWDGDRPFRYLGSNNYYIRYTEDPRAMGDVLDAARDMGMRVLRCQANGERFEPMQPGLFEPWRHLVAGGPAGFQEDAFRRYDLLVAEAAKRGIRVIIYITDNWEYLGGMRTWVRWRGLEDKNLFYTDERVKADFKGLIKAWATRRNTVSGLLYRDDPAVFSWELANEPRNEADKTSRALAAWTQEMASYWKGLDPQHMVSVGLEGALASGGEHYSGADFSVVQGVPAIDFACFHLYPVKSHLRYSLRAAKQRIRDYVRIAHGQLKKPVVMEEFGVEKKYQGDLDRFAWVGGMMEAFIQAGGDGINHWMLIDDRYKGGDGHEIQPSDTEYVNLFKRLSVRVNAAAEGKP